MDKINKYNNIILKTNLNLINKRKFLGDTVLNNCLFQYHTIISLYKEIQDVSLLNKLEILSNCLKNNCNNICK